MTSFIHHPQLFALSETFSRRASRISEHEQQRILPREVPGQGAYRAVKFDGARALAYESLQTSVVVRGTPEQTRALPNITGLDAHCGELVSSPLTRTLSMANWGIRCIGG